MVGVVLLLVVLAFGLTGYLLPWDNRAYWGTVVSTQIMGQAPLAGAYLKRLLGSDGSVGVVTFARFYALHVLILPQVIVSLIVFHIFLVRKHGVAPAPDESGPDQEILPRAGDERHRRCLHRLRDSLFDGHVRGRSPGRLADPTDLTYIPRPDWYFLFLFQTLKFFKGSLEPVGSILLPNLAILALIPDARLSIGEIEESHAAHHRHRRRRDGRHQLGRAYAGRHQDHSIVQRRKQASVEHKVQPPVSGCESIFTAGACRARILSPGKVRGLSQSHRRSAKHGPQSGCVPASTATRNG